MSAEPILYSAADGIAVGLIFRFIRVFPEATTTRVGEEND